MCCGVGALAAGSQDDTGNALRQIPRLPQVEMSAEDIVAARRLTYYLSTQAVGQIKAGIEEGGDLRRTQFAATLLARWAETLPTMFPEGTDIDSSRALPNVWSDREGFEEKAAAYSAAAAAVVAQAKTGDRDATNAAFLEMAATCQSCHDSYREKRPDGLSVTQNRN